MNKSTLTESEQMALMDYLYGEMDPAAARAFEQALTQKPALAAELARLRPTHQLVQHLLSDAESPSSSVAPPLILHTENKRMAGAYSNTLLKVAAAIALLLVAAAFARLQIDAGANGIRIAFGQPQSALPHPADQAPTLTEAPEQTQPASTEPDRLLAMHQRIDSLAGALSATRMQLRNPVAQPTPTFNPDSLRELLTQLQAQNYQLLSEWVQQSAQEQQTYTTGLIRELSAYLAQQRQADLQLIEYALNSISEEQQQQQQETGLVLSELLSRIEQKKSLTSGQN